MNLLLKTKIVLFFAGVNYSRELYCFCSAKRYVLSSSWIVCALKWNIQFNSTCNLLYVQWSVGVRQEEEDAIVDSGTDRVPLV